ncbi:MAG: hypothetical protein QXR45_08835, partial [Candidatus Bathyarchaeia archaeon]
MKKLKVLAIFIIVAIGVCLIIYNYFSAIEEGEGKFFEFYLPWDDSEGTFVSLSSLLDKPAGRFGFIHVGRDGHLYAGD